MKKPRLCHHPNIMTPNSEHKIFWFLGDTSWTSSTWILRVTDIYIRRGAFCCDLTAQSSFQLLLEKEYSETFDLIARGCVFRPEQIHTHTLPHRRYPFTFVKVKSRNMQTIFLPLKPPQFFSIFSQRTVQTITCKKSKLQSEEGKIWKSQYVICNLNNHIGNIKNSPDQKHL